jgi:hypothetical protein
MLERLAFRFELLAVAAGTKTPTKTEWSFFTECRGK